MKNFKESIECFIEIKKLFIKNVECELSPHLHYLIKLHASENIELVFGRLVQSKLDLEILERLIKLEDDK